MSSCRIAIDAHRLVCETHTSGHVYLASLVREWTSAQNPPELFLLVPFQPQPEKAASSLFSLPGVRVVTLKRSFNPTSSFKAQVFWQQVLIPRLLFKLNAQVYFSPFHLTPLLSSAQKVVTAIHDLCFLQEPCFGLGSIIHRAQVLSACLRSHRLICVSRFTYDMLYQWSPRAAHKAAIVPNGISSNLLPIGQARQVLAHLGRDLNEGEYLIWVGHPSPRKNPELLMETSALHLRSFPTHKLAIIAPRASHPYLNALAEFKQIRSLVLLDSVDSMIRDALYRCALALVFPSRCEGFGYPIAEAMAQGCPPIALENSPARELVGGAVSLAKTATAAAFCEIIRHYAEKTLEQRSRDGEHLVAQAQKYSTRAMAEGTLNVLTR